MNTKNLLKLSALVVVLLVLASVSVFAQQLSTVYVDVTNGSDTYTGANATNSPAGTGPKATINGGLGAVAPSGTVVIFAGTYAESVDIITTTYTKLVAGSSLTIQLATLNSNGVVAVTGGSGFKFEISGGTLNITTASGTESLSLSQNLTLGNSTMNSTMNIGNSSNFVMATGKTITMWGTSNFSSQAPKKGTNLTLTYAGDGDVTAGPEANYGSYGSGTMTFGKTSGAVTMPYAITKAGGISVTGNNVTFNGAVTLGDMDVKNTGTGTVTFNGPLNFALDNNNSDDIGCITNTSTGTINVTAGVTWTSSWGSLATLNSVVYPQITGQMGIENASTGTVSINAITLVSYDTVATVTFTAYNNGGTLSLGTVTAAATSVYGGTVSLNVNNNAAAGTVNIAGGTVRGYLTNAGSATTNITGATTVGGAVTNSGTLALGSNTLTLSSTSATHAFGTVTGNGTVAISKGGSTISGATLLPSVTVAGSTTVAGVITSMNNLTITSGTFTVNAAATVLSTGTTTLSGTSTSGLSVATGITFSTGGFTQTNSSSTVTLTGTAVLDIKGSFNRTVGTFTAAAGSTVQFTGTSSQSVNGGTLFTVGNLTFTNTNGLISLGQSIRAQGTVTINASTNVALGTLNIILTANNAAMINSGSYSASGGGGVIFGGATTVSNGGTAPVTGQTFRGTGTYSYITIDVGNTDVTCNATGTDDVKFNGVLTLTSGNIKINAGTFGPVGSSASVIRNIATAGGSVKGVYGTGFNSNAPTNYDLQYTGALTTTNTLDATGGTTGVELSTTYVRNLTFATTQTGTATATETRLEITSTGALTINGDLTLSAPSTGNVNQVLLPAQDLTVKGVLSVPSGSVLGVSNSGYAIYLPTDNKVHPIAGSIAVMHGSASAHNIIVTGNGIAVNGSSVAADASTIANLAFEPSGDNYTFTSTGFKYINGAVNVQALGSFGSFVGPSTKSGATATITMDATDANVTGNLTVGNTTVTPTVTMTVNGSNTATHTGNITLTNGTLNYTGTTLTGAMTLTAGTLNLGAKLTVTGLISQVAGNLNIGAFTLTEKGSYTRTGAGAVTGTGTLAMSGTTTLTPGTTLTIPNLTFVAGAATIANSMTVSGAITHTAGSVVLTTGTLTFSGNTYTFTAGTYLAGFAIAFTGSNPTLTAAGDIADMRTVTVNTTGTFTFASNKTGSANVRSLTTTTAFTQTAGVIAIGNNSIKIGGGTFTFTAGSWTMGTGYLVWNTGGTITLGTGFAVDNLELSTSSSLASTAMAWTVNKNLWLNSGILTVDAGKLTLGDGCTVRRDADGAVLSSIPTKAGAVSVSYQGVGIVTAANFFELPATVTNFSVGRSGTTTPSVTLPKAVTVNGTLSLYGVLTNSSTNNITMANNSTIVLGQNGTTVINSTALTLGTGVNIKYDGATATTIRELGALNSGNTAYANASGAITFASGTVTLDKILTIGGTVTFDGGNFDMGGNAVTVQGDVVQTANDGWFANSGAAKALTFAGLNTNLTLDAAWSVPASIKVTLNKTANTNTVTLSGNNIDFAANSATLYFTSGLLVTGSQVITLKQGSSSGQPTQGFSRTAGHVVGQVKKFVDKTDVVAISRVEFPVGTPDGFYRPFATYFKNTPQSSINMTVSHSNVRPGGQNGYPIHDGALTITNYPNFFWYVKSDISLAPSYLFDMEAQAEGYTDYATDGIQNMRLVRRDSGLVSNQWVEQKNNNTGTVLYDNSTIAANWPAVKVVDATGGITTQGSIFSYSQINKAPIFNPAPASMTKNEGDTVSVTFTAADPDLGDVAVMSAITKPAGSTFDASTGKFTWIIGFDLATKATPTATATVTIRATDTYGPLSKDTSIVITINNVNRAPKFNPRTVTSTPKDTDTLRVTLAATDADADALTYTYLSATPTPANVPTVAGTVLTWKPAFADIGLTFTIKALVSDGAGGTDTLTVSATVGRTVKRGDVDGNGTVQAADASLVLKHVAGITLITDPAALYAADATNNGTISAFDAAYILQAAAGLITLPASATSSDNLSLNKIGTVAGSLSMGAPEATKDAEVVKVALKLSNAANVYAAQLTSKADFSLMSIEGVSAALPEGWQMQWNVVDNELRVAMAGTTPLSNGEVAAITVRLKNKESRLNFSSDAMLNENSQSLGAVEIAAVPTTFALEQNYPNPFNPSTTMKYQIPNDANVNLDVYNLQGQKIRTLVAKEQKAGYYSVVWDGRNEAGQTVSSGLYLYRVQAGSFVAVHKMMLIK